MTTMLQRIMDGNIQHSYPSGRHRIVSDMVHQVMLARLKPDPASVYKRGLKPLLAERYMFSDLDPSRVIDDAVEAGQLTREGVFTQARLPVDIAWLEWKMSDPTNSGHKPAQLGVLIDTSPDWEIAAKLVWQQDATMHIMVYYAHSEDHAPRLVMMCCPTEPIGGRPNIHFFVPFLEEVNPTEDPQELPQLVMQDIMSLLFLITTPRTTEIVRQEWSSKIQKARRRRGKGPLLEYRKVTLVVGSTRRVVLPDGPHGPSSPRRLHQVVGHWRKYLQGRNEPYHAWVPQHWRGDAKLGIVMHDRSVKIPGAPNEPRA